MIWAVRLLNAALLLASALVCAHWFWIFAAPPIVAPRQQSAPQPVGVVDAIRRAGLFGSAAHTAIAGRERRELVLRGIYASREGGMAVIAVDSTQPPAIRIGEEVAPGIVLERVLADHVVVNESGVARRLDLPERKSFGARADTVGTWNRINH